MLCAFIGSGFYEVCQHRGFTHLGICRGFRSRNGITFSRRCDVHVRHSLLRFPWPKSKRSFDTNGGYELPILGHISPSNLGNWISFFRDIYITDFPLFRSILSLSTASSASNRQSLACRNNFQANRQNGNAKSRLVIESCD